MTTVAFRLLFRLALLEGFGASELSGLDPWYFVRRRAAWALKLLVILGPSTRRATVKLGIVNMSGDACLPILARALSMELLAASRSAATHRKRHLPGVPVGSIDNTTGLVELVIWRRSWRFVPPPIAGEPASSLGGPMIGTLRVFQRMTSCCHITLTPPQECCRLPPTYFWTTWHKTRALLISMKNKNLIYCLV